MERDTISTRNSQSSHIREVASSKQPVANERRGAVLATLYWLSPSPGIPALLTLFLGSLVGVAFFLRPLPAYADPHAVFYTDRAQEQLFFNVLAALNQADYVENPDTPTLTSDQRLGEFIKTGKYIASQTPKRTIERDANGNIRVTPALEPAEQQDVELPRVRARLVTSDDGDVFYRERLERRALAEEMRVLLARLTCRASETIYGPAQAHSSTYCPPTENSPDIVPLSPI